MQDVVDQKQQNQRPTPSDRARGDGGDLRLVSPRVPDRPGLLFPGGQLDGGGDMDNQRA
jgi:hypothetical protein